MSLCWIQKCVKIEIQKVGQQIEPLFVFHLFVLTSDFASVNIVFFIFYQSNM